MTLAIIIGTMTPKKATNFLNPELCLKALLQTTNTNAFTASWQNPAITANPTNTFVKFAIRKKPSPVIPETVIQNEFLLITRSYLSAILILYHVLYIKASCGNGVEIVDFDLGIRLIRAIRNFMRVILLQNIKGFGQIGEVKSVSDGHARNFLFPRKLAKIATENTLKEVATLSLKREAMNLKNQEAATKAVAVLATMNLEFKKKASPTGTLFSSVTRHEIAQELTKRSGMKIETEMIDIGEHGEHIKHIGEHAITVELVNGLKADMKISIKGE